MSNRQINIHQKCSSEYGYWTQSPIETKKWWTKTTSESRDDRKFSDHLRATMHVWDMFSSSE